jgi:hypothetical protein
MVPPATGYYLDRLPYTASHATRRRLRRGIVMMDSLLELDPARSIHKAIRDTRQIPANKSPGRATAVCQSVRRGSAEFSTLNTQASPETMARGFGGFAPAPFFPTIIDAPCASRRQVELARTPASSGCTSIDHEDHEKVSAEGMLCAAGRARAERWRGRQTWEASGYPLFNGICLTELSESPAWYV